jgi:hypothetical protein
MDLAKLQKKSILIPTPGQTEQEYLATQLWQKKMAFSIEQKEFYLSPVLEAAKKFNCRFSLTGNGIGLHAAVKSFLDSLR